jgi:hypothetical protein
MALVQNPKRDADLRAMAVGVLLYVDAPGLRSWLSTGLVTRRGLLRRQRLAPKTPVSLAQVRVLAARWPDAPEVVRILELARRSGDAEWIAAADKRKE